ncbi:hypothetical protein [Fangia hongkongensis]|uniref:hypothetical protein n=1 Tax=Fangia hongkongensis TaxID=270495 RepID=UPI00037DF027|nr:hypothetical protein [Fangia hongkongensis]MBK2123896.1 hypothetical protein [Fangia hongkongensis]
MSEHKLSEKKIFQLWWLHDARWYQEVATEFGFAVANRLNKKILIFLAERVARQEVKKYLISNKIASMEDVIEIIQRCSQRMWPDEMVEIRYRVESERVFEVDVTRNFALYMLRLANSLENYECPCFEIRSAWFSEMNINIKKHKITQCCMQSASACTFYVELDLNKTKKGSYKCSINQT